MTSIFDQYNKTLKRDDVQSINTQNSGPPAPTSSGYVSVRMKQESPIFSKRKMKLNLPNDIQFLSVQNNWLITLMSHQVLLRLFLLQPDRQDEVVLQKHLNGMKVANIFLDPLGIHLLISITNGSSSELLYLHRKTTKPKRMEKFRDNEITAVAFNFENKSETTTGSILIGTSKGLIFETEFGIEGGEKKMQNNWKQVFDIGKGDQCPITGIEFHKVPTDTRYNIIIVSTIDRIYTFHEILKVEEKSPYLYNIFNSYLNVPENLRDFYEIPNKLKTSKLRFNYDYDKISEELLKPLKFPKIFGFLTSSGIFSGEIDQLGLTPQFINATDTIPFPNTSQPISFALTDFHVLLLYIDHVTAISLLNYQIVYEEYFTEQYGKLGDIITDVRANTIYVYSSKSIFQYKITNEHRNVWRMYLDKNEFELARKYCGDNPAHLDIVLVKQAELFFANKDYMRSAAIFSETQTSFEGVCLRFLDEVNEKQALMIFLRARLDALKSTDKTQITMLVVWMVELYLTEMAQYTTTTNNDSVSLAKCMTIQKEFDQFLNLPRVIECIRSNRTVIYDLMASHGDNFNLTSLTTVNRDFESVVNQYINQCNYSDALSVLTSQNQPDLYYKYCPILMEEIPKETTSALIAAGKRLNPIKLLPTLIRIDTDAHADEVIRYLEFCIHSLSSTEQAIHNFLIRMYGQRRSEKTLMSYLEMEGKDVTTLHYDVHYALRVCGEHNAKEACVFLQCLLELWHPAVELALTFDPLLAQQTASQPNDDDLRRNLWLRIAEHEIKGKDVVTQALDLLKKCDNLLRIEDLLPFFSDFEKIDHFKEAICEALQKYNEKIQDQRRDMEESAKSAEIVRNNLQTFRNRSIIINGQDLCAICNAYLLLKPFFLFPCGHKFHEECLEKDILNYLNSEDARKLTQIKQQLLAIAATNNNNNNNSNAPIAETNSMTSTSILSKDQIKADYEQLIASECLFCGEYMINSIDKPFIDWEKVNNEWL